MRIAHPANVAAARELIRSGRGHVHFTGICGVGMAGLASLLAARGFKVTGCDASPGVLAGWLARQGVEVLTGHNPAHITPDVSWIVRTSAVSPDDEEPAAAVQAGIKVFLRGEVLPAMLEGATSIAVSGTHGKTTTTGFIAQVLKTCGRDPSFCVGGELDILGGVAGTGRGGILVVEADESDGTAALYEPDYAVITNIEPDHMENFGSLDSLKECFRRFAARARRAVIYCADDPGAVSVCSALPGAVSYGFSDLADVRACDVKQEAGSVRFAVQRGDSRLGQVTIPMPGRHNVLNALATVAVAMDLGLDFSGVASALSLVSLAKRRFERIVESGGVLVISDYAHHPTEIRALIGAARGLGRGRIVSVFQPHRYTRTAAMSSEFAGAFDGVDELVLVPVYAASERPVRGGTAWDLYSHFRQRTGAGVPRVLAAGGLDQAWNYLRRILRDGDLFLVVGAGDVEKIAFLARDAAAGEGIRFGTSDATFGPLRSLLTASTMRFDEPMARRTTLRVGGNADVWIDIGSRADLATIAKWSNGRGIPFRVIGGGSNLLVSDLGVRGITGRLTGEEFRGIREQKGIIVAGAGVFNGDLLRWSQEKGRGGLEFLEGIPGTVGGALCMNAGAWGEEIGKHTAWVRCVDKQGVEFVDTGTQFGYRTGVRSGLVVEAGLAVIPRDPLEIRHGRETIADRRQWMRDIHCAGSFFMNPADDFAGRMIEQAGLKGMRVGGAFVSDRHANVIATEEGATASDVRALAEIVRSEVRHRHGVELKTEVGILE